MMRKLMVIALLGLALLAFIAMVAVAQEAKEEAKQEAKQAGHEYVGAEKCAKVCHKDQHSSWLETKHSKAFDLLSDEEKAKPECGGACHITAKLADGTVLPGVECEACHGPGKDYKSPKIMSKSKWAGDPDAYRKMAVEAGLVYPTAETCAKCHKEEGNPNFKPLDFDKSKGTVHPVSSE